MKSLVFDSSSVISITTNNLLDVLYKLKEKFQGEFLISHTVKEELIENPLRRRRFELQAIMLADTLARGNFKFFDNTALNGKAEELTELANTTFFIDKNPLKIVDKAEVEGLILAGLVNAEAYVMDERTLRLFVEDYKNLLQLLERKFESRVEVDKDNLKRFKELIGNVKIIRSVELMTVAFEYGFFNEYNLGRKYVEDYKKKILEGILWGLRLRGCGISTREINDIMRIERV